MVICKKEGLTMSNITRWNPYQEMSNMRRLMRRMFEDPYLAPEFEGDQMAMWDLPLDVMESQDEYVVKASLPGINPDDLEVTYNNNTLTIRGEIKAEDEKKEQRYHLRERRFGSFQRSIYLPTPIQSDKVQANFDSGVLTLRLPKTEEVKPKRIPVRAGGQGQKQIDTKARAAAK
jgi:HSP20 family protein